MMRRCGDLLPDPDLAHPMRRTLPLVHASSHLEAGEEGGVWRTCYVDWRWQVDAVPEHVAVLTPLSSEHGKMRDAIWIRSCNGGKYIQREPVVIYFYSHQE